MSMKGKVLYKGDWGKVMSSVQPLNVRNLLSFDKINKTQPFALHINDYNVATRCILTVQKCPGPCWESSQYSSKLRGKSVGKGSRGKQEGSECEGIGGGVQGKEERQPPATALVKVSGCDLTTCVQRLRDNIKTWLASSDIKDKKSMQDAKKLIEMVRVSFRDYVSHSC